MNRKGLLPALFGRRKPPAPTTPHGERNSTSIPRHIVKRESGYQEMLMPGGMPESQMVHTKRYKLLTEMKKIAMSDPRVNRILYKLSADATEESFSVTVEDGPGKRIQRQAQGTLDRCRLLIKDKEHIRGWVESLLRDGDLFLQLQVSPEKEITGAKKLAAEITFSRQDAKGEFPKEMKPYYQAKHFDHEVLAEFEEWEIVHAKWRAEDGKPYGTPLFMAGQQSVKRVESGEDDMSIRRKLRAGMRFFFNIGTPDNPGSWDEVKRFQEQNKDSLENPVNAVTNFFGNGLMDMKAIQGDSQLGNKEDIDHFEGLISMTGLTPSALISGGREKATNLNVIDAEEEDYGRTLLAICKVAENGAIRPIFDTALLLDNINPDSVDYTINWGVKLRESTVVKLRKAELWIKLGFSHETAYNLADIDNGLTFEEECERIEEQIERGVIPYRGTLLNNRVEQATQPPDGPQIEEEL